MALLQTHIYIKKPHMYTLHKLSTAAAESKINVLWWMYIYFTIRYISSLWEKYFFFYSKLCILKS